MPSSAPTRAVQPLVLRLWCLWWLGLTLLLSAGLFAPTPSFALTALGPVAQDARAIAWEQAPPGAPQPFDVDAGCAELAEDERADDDDDDDDRTERLLGPSPWSLAQLDTTQLVQHHDQGTSSPSVARVQRRPSARAPPRC